MDRQAGGPSPGAGRITGRRGGPPTATMVGVRRSTRRLLGELDVLAHPERMATLARRAARRPPRGSCRRPWRTCAPRRRRTTGSWPSTAAEIVGDHAAVRAALGDRHVGTSRGRREGGPARRRLAGDDLHHSSGTRRPTCVTWSTGRCGTCTGRRSPTTWSTACWGASGPSRRSPCCPPAGRQHRPPAAAGRRTRVAGLGLPGPSPRRRGARPRRVDAAPPPTRRTGPLVDGARQKRAPVAGRRRPERALTLLERYAPPGTSPATSRTTARSPRPRHDGCWPC